MPNTVTLSAVGDISFGDYPFCIGCGVGSILEMKGAEFTFEKIRHIFDNDDIVFGNLETTLSLYGLNKKKLHSIELRGNPMAVESLMACKFNVINMANNHALQHGEKAFYETVDLLDTNNIKQIGLLGENDWYSRPVFIEIKGIRFGFLGYAFETDKYFNGHIKYAFGKPEHIEHDIAKLRPEIDYLIVSYHWGLEFMDRPSVSNIRLARQTIDWGADIVLGHHPHVLQGVERYNKGIIFYSLGNFVFDMHWDRRFNQSIIAKLIFDESKSISYEIIPIVINDYCQPEVANDQNAIQIKELVNNSSWKIYEELCGDTEYNSYKYYLEYEKSRKKNRLKSYIYFIRNIYRLRLPIIFQMIIRTALRKTDDLKTWRKNSFFKKL